MKKQFGFGLALALGLTSSGAFAQSAAAPTPSDSSEAGEEDAEASPEAPEKGSREYLVLLVTDGAALYDQKKYDQAQVKLREAYSLNPSPTIGIVLAHAYRDDGQLGNAMDTYQLVAGTDVAEDAHPRVIQAVSEAKEEYERLKSKTNWLTLAVSGPAEFAVTFNGEEREAHRSGAYVLMPGVYSVTVTAAGYLERTLEFVAHPGQRPVQVVEMKKEAMVVPPAAPATVLAPTPREKPRPQEPEEERTGAFKALGWVSISGGVAGLMAGTGLVMYAWTENERSENYCDDQVCSAEAQAPMTNARKGANSATIAYAVGGGLTAVGVTLFVLDGVHKRKHRRKYEDTTRISLTPTGARLSGRF